MHDSVLVALISAVGSIIVAYLTTHQSSKPSYDELKKENEELKRKLKEENTTFQQQLNHTRELLAKHYLKNSDLTNEDIAYLLGYQDSN
ncbi:MAG: hypothetical protein SPC26_09535, partial [Lactobacillus amylovorus]|nr:hypothetical protein [Lactobacillus amylovorus]